MPNPPDQPSRDGFADEYPFDSHWLDLDGVRMHYVDEGGGRPVLFVHGNPTWSFAWRNFVKSLSGEYRTLAVDHVGCGFSDKPRNYRYRFARHIDNLCRFVEALDLSDLTLVGHDWGGAIGMGAAGRMPGRFGRIVLMNTAAFRSKRLPWRIRICRAPLFGAVAVRGLNLFARMALRMAVADRGRITPAIRAGYLAPYDSWSHRIAVHRFVQDIPLSESHPSFQTLLDVERSLVQFRDVPMQLIWGERDWCFTVDFLHEFQVRFPHAQTVSLPEAGHYAFEDATEQVVETVRRFMVETV